MRTPIALTAALLLASPAFAKGKPHLDKKAALAKAAKVTLADAAGKAAAKGTPFEAELKKKNGKVVWEFEVRTQEDKTVEIDVDADSGEVIDSEAKK